MTLIDKVRDAYEGLSDRERRLVSLAVGLLGAILIVGSIFSIWQSIHKKQNSLEATKSATAEMYDLESAFKQAKRFVDTQKRRLASNDTHLVSMVEQVSRQLDVTLYEMQEKSEKVENAAIVEKLLTFEVKELSLDRLTALMEGILEYSDDDLVRIVRLKVKKNYEQASLLDAQMTVATWVNSTELSHVS